LKSRLVLEEVYPHEFLWRSASALLKKAEAEERARDYLLLPSLLVSFMAYEAFVNFCGFALLPKVWAKEKENFKGRGIEAKLEALILKLPSFSWQKGKPPYQNVKRLEEFRDMVAHGKVTASTYVAQEKDDGSHFRFQSLWSDYISVEAVKAFRSDLKSFCQSLVVELRKASDHPHLNHDAFEGSLASGTSSSVD